MSHKRKKTRISQFTQKKIQYDSFEDSLYDDSNFESGGEALSKITSNNENDQKQIKRRREDTSLKALAKQFVKLIKSSEDNTLDLNDTVKLLGVQKRRIYDITNVLEGIGYITKPSKNKIQWVGGATDLELENEIENMEKEMEEMAQQEAEMDKWIEYLHSHLQDNFLHNAQEMQYTYLTYDDFQNLGRICAQQSGEALFIITAPKGTLLEIPIINDQQSQFPHQLILNSKSEEIQIYLCADEQYPLKPKQKKEINNKKQ